VHGIIVTIPIDLIYVLGSLLKSLCVPTRYLDNGNRTHVVNASRELTFFRSISLLYFTFFLPPFFQAASVIVSTAHDFSLELPMSPRPWWEAFVGNKDVGETDVVTAANTIVGLSNLDKVSDCDARMDFIIASRGYVQSCIVGSEGSFLDSASPGRPASFIWEHLADSVSRMSLSRCDG